MRKLALFAAVVCAMVGLAVSAFGAPPPPAPTSVTVVNPSSSPAQISGPVTVANAATAPVPVTDVNRPGFQPVIITFPEAGWPHTSYLVPAGKVLVIDNVNTFFYTLGDMVDVWVSFGGGNVERYRFLPLEVRAGSQWLAGQWSPRLYFAAGTEVRAYWLAAPSGATTVMHAGTMSGYLINAP